jgi:phosphoadenosine phosphosulfate reductase
VLKRTWCKNCNKIVYGDRCDCGEVTQEDIPIEINWCPHCHIPIIHEAVDNNNICPICGGEIKYLSKDLRPVFPEERLLIEIIANKPLEYMNKSVWADGSKYFIDGKSTNLSIESIKKIDTEYVIAELNKYKKENNYNYFNNNINLFIEANKERLAIIEDEAFKFVNEQVANFPKHQLVISFSGGKDSTAVADIVTRALSDPSIVHIFGDTTLEFPATYEYISRFRRENPKAIVKTAKNKEQEFYDVCDEIGPPARMMRWCCTMFKTGPITRILNSVFKDSFILTFYGIRKHESTARSKYDRVANGANVKIQKQTVAAPIFYWNDIEVWLYLLGENVDFNDAYRLGYDRVGCWCCPNNNARAQLLSKIYMPEQSEKWRNYLIDFAKKVGKPDPEIYVDNGKWKARQGGNGLVASEDVKIKFTNCTAEDHAKIYRLNKPFSDEFINLFVPFGKVSKELGRKLLNEVLVLDLNTNVPILSIQPFNKEDYEFAVKVKTLNVEDHEGLQKKVAYQVRKFNACRKCLKCESVCPFGAITVNSLMYKIDENKCRHCKKCVTNKYLDGGCLMERFLRAKEDSNDED